MKTDERSGNADQRRSDVALARDELPAKPSLRVAIEHETGGDADNEYDQQIRECTGDDGHVISPVEGALHTARKSAVAVGHTPSAAMCPRTFLSDPDRAAQQPFYTLRLSPLLWGLGYVKML